MSEHPSPDESGTDESRDVAGESSRAAPARLALMASGLAFFVTGVAFTVAMPDNFAIGITFLVLGVVFYSIAGTARMRRGGATGRDESPRA